MTEADLLRENAELRTAFNYELGVRKILEKRIIEIRAEEREACAKIAHHYWVRWDHPTNMKCAETIEKAIRARGDGGEQAG